ncbi:MAG: hypothetical protein H0U21_01945 [Acidimicrobiia bacterium]|nr:hypothetical protein [Acidimicrobiia bacterium]
MSVERQTVAGSLVQVATHLAATDAQDLRRQLPPLTSGEGVMETDFGGYRPVRGAPPRRERTNANPLNRDEYLREVAGRPAYRDRPQTS